MTHATKTVYVECPVCGGWYAGMRLKGGDGIIVPRKHHKKIFFLHDRFYTSKEIYEGSYMEGKNKGIQYDIQG